jgi:hypothetical protein
MDQPSEKPNSSLSGSLGVLIHCHPKEAAFDHALSVIGQALKAGRETYLYLLDQGVLGLTHATLMGWSQTPLRCFACALALEVHEIEAPEWVIPSGLTLLSDILLQCDEICVYNPADRSS